MVINVDYKFFTEADASLSAPSAPPDHLQETVAELYSRQMGLEEESLLPLDPEDVEPLADFDPERLEEFHVDEIGNLFEKLDFKDERAAEGDERARVTPADGLA